MKKAASLLLCATMIFGMATSALAIELPAGKAAAFGFTPATVRVDGSQPIGDVVLSLQAEKSDDYKKLEGGSFTLALSDPGATFAVNGGGARYANGKISWVTPGGESKPGDAVATISDVTKTMDVILDCTRSSAYDNDDNRIIFTADQIADQIDVTSAKIIVQNPVNVVIEGEAPAGGRVEVKATNYAETGDTYDQGGRALDLTGGGKFFVDSGDGQQDEPVLSITVPARYRAEIKIGNGNYSNAVPNHSLGEISQETDVAVRFIKISTAVAVSVAPTAGGDISFNNSSVAGQDVEFDVNNLTKQFLITPAEGYALEDVLYDGTSVKDEVTSTGRYTLVMTKAGIEAEDQDVHHTLEVKFVSKTFDVLAQVVGNAGGVVQFNNETVTNGKFNIAYTASPITVNFVPADNTYEVEKVEITTNGGTSWTETVKADSYTFENGITSPGQGVRVTFKAKINDIVVPGDEIGGAQIAVLRGVWANEGTKNMSVTVNGTIYTGADTAAHVTWSVAPGYYNSGSDTVVETGADGTALKGFGFTGSSLRDGDIVSVDANGVVTVKASGIVRVRATSKVDSSKYADIIIIVPGDYNRDGFVDYADAGSIQDFELGISAGIHELPYADMMGDLNQDDYRDYADAGIDQDIELGIKVIR